MSDKATSPAELREAFLAAVRPLPTTAGGTAIVVATAGPPPAVNLLSTGDISVADDTVRIAVFANNSLVTQLGGSCTILVPSDGAAVRVSLQPAVARPAGPLAVIEGNIVSVRPSVEPPWSLHLNFRPVEEQGRGVFVDSFVNYWTQVRSWLEQGAPGEGPQPPTSH